MSVQSEQQLITRAEEIRTATEQYSITEEILGQLLIDIINTSFDNIPDSLTAGEIKALLLENADTNLLTDSEKSKVDNIPTNTNTALSGKENVGVAQSLVDGLKDSVPFSGNTLNKLYNLLSSLSVGLNTKASSGDPRLTDERTPIDNSVTAAKIVNGTIPEDKFTSGVRDKLNQVSGATGYNTASFNADFAGKDTDDLTQGSTNLYFTTAEKTKLSGIESGATADQSATEIESLYESRPDTNKYTDSDKSKVVNLPSNTISSLAGKENTGVAQSLIDDLKDNVPTSGDTLHKLFILLGGKASTGDTRFTDQRTPLNNSVSTAKLQDEAVTAAKIELSGITQNRLSSTVQNILNSVSGKENTGVAQSLIDDILDSVPSSGNTLNKLYNLLSGLSVGLNTKVSTGDTRLSDERTPLNNSVSTAKLQDSAVTEVKLSSGVRDKLNQVSGATGYNSTSFDADFSGKTSDDLQQGTTNQYLTNNSVSAAKIQDGVISKVKLTQSLQDEINSISGGTGYNSSDFDTDFSGKTSDDLSQGSSNLFLTTSERSKLINVPTNTISELAGKASTGDSRFTDERTPIDDSVSTDKIQDNSVTNAKIADGEIVKAKLIQSLQDSIDSIALKENAGVAQSLIDNLKAGVPISGNTLNKLNALIVQNSQNINDKVDTTDARLSDQRTPIDNSVSTAKIQDGAITTSKLADDLVIDCGNAFD